MQEQLLKKLEYVTRLIAFDLKSDDVTSALLSYPEQIIILWHFEDESITALMHPGDFERKEADQIATETVNYFLWKQSIAKYKPFPSEGYPSGGICS